MGEAVLCLLAYGLTGAALAGVGVFQLRSRDPVGFYTGQKPPKPEQLTDVAAWNRGHGRLFVGYGIAVALAGVLPLLLPAGGGLAALAVFVAGFPALLWGHHRLIRRYFHQESLNSD